MVASVTASVLFGVLFYLPPLVTPLGADSIFAWRVFITIPLVVLAFLVSRKSQDLLRILGRVRRRPALLLVILCNGLLLGVQLWIFGWAPISGHGLEVALGYLLLPLMMVVTGRVIHGESLRPLRLASVVVAAAGVASAIVLAGGISPATMVVALGYPVYFELRARFDLSSPGALGLELAVLLPIAVCLSIWHTWPTTDGPRIIVGLLVIGLVSAFALLLYLRASELLPFGLFGLLTYVEPLLLVAVSIVLLGEPLSVVDLLVYGPIAVALCLLGIETARASRNKRFPSTGPSSDIGQSESQ
ncbi:EamA family transporter RarD [Microbacterium sp. Root280D1]|uniref:EamA family transporter RarD n=1 Tax=Microbacterium sp. Root280D1 TaxID=1736510 RepID=UPI000AE58D87|nr:EamA family transporter RarD [Microbacterium sp. Root280D1]